MFRQAVKVCGQGDCSEHADRGFACAPIWTCKDNRIITDGKVSSELPSPLIRSKVSLRESLASDGTGTRRSSAVSGTPAPSTCLTRNVPTLTRFAARTPTSEPNSVQSTRDGHRLRHRNPGLAATQTKVRYLVVLVEKLGSRLRQRRSGAAVGGTALADLTSRARTIPPWRSRASSPICASSTGQSAQLSLTSSKLLSLLLRVQDGQRVYIGGASLIAPNKLLTVAHKFWVV